MSIALVLTNVTPSLAAETFFQDIPTSHWAPSVGQMVDKGIIVGYPMEPLSPTRR